VLIALNIFTNHFYGYLPVCHLCPIAAVRCIFFVAINFYLI